MTPTTLRRVIRLIIRRWCEGNNIPLSVDMDALADEILDTLRKREERVIEPKPKFKSNIDVDVLADSILSALRKRNIEVVASTPDLKKERAKKSSKAEVGKKKNASLRTKFDYQTYLISDEWREKAETAKERVGNRCQLCNRSRDVIGLEAHHRTYERVGNELPEDITVLCNECHEQFEMTTKYRPRDANNDRARANCDGCNASYEKWQLTKIRKMYLCPKCQKDIL